MGMPSEIRDMFEENLYVEKESDTGTATNRHQISDLIRALPLCMEADAIQSSLRKNKRQATVEEADVIAKVDELRDGLIQVDVFDSVTKMESEVGYTRPALVGTEERMNAMDRKRFEDWCA